jgi:hypothetical protein
VQSRGALLLLPYLCIPTAKAGCYSTPSSGILQISCCFSLGEGQISICFSLPLLWRQREKQSPFYSYFNLLSHKNKKKERRLRRDASPFVPAQAREWKDSLRRDMINLISLKIRKRDCYSEGTATPKGLLLACAREEVGLFY